MLGQEQHIIADGFSISDFLYPRNKEYGIKESYEQGGIELYNPKYGLQDYIWKAWIENDTVFIKRDDLDNAVEFLKDKNISEIDLTFDQNMNPCLAYVADNIPKLYFYDTAKAVYVTMTFKDIKNPKISLDDKRDFNISQSNIVFAYMRDNNLYIRLQRDRFGVEYLLKSFDDDKTLYRIGMGVNNRFLFCLY